jgi:hypothetical protein
MRGQAFLSDPAASSRFSLRLVFGGSRPLKEGDELMENVLLLFTKEVRNTL